MKKVFRTVGERALPPRKKSAGLGIYIVSMSLVVSLILVILCAEVGQLVRIRKEVHEDMRRYLHTDVEFVESTIDGLYASIEAMAPSMVFESGFSQEDMLLNMKALKSACGFDFVVRTNVMGIAMNDLGKENIDLSQRDYIKEALQKNRRSFGYVESGAYDANNAFLILAVPIVCDDKVVGVLHGSYSTSKFGTMLASLNEAINQISDSISIVDPNGRVIASSDTDVSDALLAYAHQDESKRDGAPSAMRLDMQACRGGYDRVEHAGQVRYAYYEPIEGILGCDWFLVFGLNEAYITSQSAYAQNSAIVMLSVALAVSIVLICLVRQYRKLVLEQERRAELLTNALAESNRAGLAKNQFLSTVSHEIRTPLNAIIGFLALAKDAKPSQAEAYRENSELAAKQLLYVINDVLDMSAIESGKMKIACEPFDFQQLIYSVTNTYRPLCAQKGVVFETKLLSPLDDHLIGDSMRVNQILMNLLGNAVKFTDKGYVQLTVRQIETQDGKAFIQFDVADTGCGMSDGMMSRLFCAFEQESATTAQEYGGSGLGLSIVKNLVSLMDGAIHAESKLGEGSRFIVDLPFGRCEADNEPTTSKHLETLRVLAIQGNQAERQYLSALLGRMGVRHTFVDNGDEALSELRRADQSNDSYNACMMDSAVQSAIDRELIRQIRRSAPKGDMQTIVFAYENPRDEDEANKIGADYVLAKPVFQSSLASLFMKLTGESVAKAGCVAPTNAGISGKRVLVAEDHVLNRMVVIGLLERFGIDCDIAEDGLAAVEQFTESKPGWYDAILMDIQMPNMDGFEATRAIRASAHPNARTIPILALTANAFNEDIAKALSVGMNGHIAKPIDPAALASALRTAFADRGAP